MIVTSNPNNYGQLNIYETPRGETVTGPLQADSEIEQDSDVSSIITPLDQHGSLVLLGNNITVPLDQSILYIRPLYVTSSTNPMPQLRYVIAVYNQQVSIEPTLDQALSSVLNESVSGTSPAGSSGGTTPPPTTSTVAQYLANASADYTAAQKALANGQLGTYQHDVNEMNAQLKLAQSALTTGTTTKTTKTSTKTTTSTSTTTTSTTAPPSTPKSSSS
jgi:hypothetical protein